MARKLFRPSVDKLRLFAAAVEIFLARLRRFRPTISSGAFPSCLSFNLALSIFQMLPLQTPLFISRLTLFRFLTPLTHSLALHLSIIFKPCAPPFSRNTQHTSKSTFRKMSSNYDFMSQNLNIDKKKKLSWLFTDIISQTNAQKGEASTFVT